MSTKGAEGARLIIGGAVVVTYPGLILSILIGLVIAFFTREAYKGGEISLRTTRIRRAESPATFQTVLILRALFGVFLVVVGVWGIFDAGRHG
jgi:hypothetical protein